MPSFIVADHGSLAQRIREVLNFGGLDCPSSHVLAVDDAAGRLEREPVVDLVVLALSTDPERGLNLLPTLKRVAGRKVLAVGPGADTKLVLKALRGGAEDYIDASELEAELEAAIARITEASRTPVEAGRLIAVLGPNGGSGSSTIAVNIAAALATAKEAKPVGLIDLKLESGDLASLLDLKPSYTLADLCQNVARLDRTMFERSLAQHSSGIRLLAAPLHLSDVARVRVEGITHALNLALAEYPYVIADVPSTFREEPKVVLRNADTIIIVLRLDFSSLRNVRKTFEALEGLDIPPEKIRLVANRYGQPQEVPYAKAEEALGRKIQHYIPEDAKTINRANNHGVPAVVEAASSKVAKALIQLAGSLATPRRRQTDQVGR